ncbi:hypothetical protein LEP1GSC193_0682 [Leptospira alstonii serovar Pingchang str. 80-412]|uniref:Uncharacterized protein n=2 Tax=Leptospira alstonii TaxID=28452 RepID=M6CWK9_9LEPT|nr:hypothetical protein LEP1GSC194_1546 [Leptospira alstonii serovar Sichuan str. 79601]EQA82153.1 hypothetical protein LEP1GSC193_0682 [Leptospira alstonii serovar Pingchang str. 80-412]
MLVKKFPLFGRMLTKIKNFDLDRTFFIHVVFLGIKEKLKSFSFDKSGEDINRV